VIEHYETPEPRRIMFGVECAERADLFVPLPVGVKMARIADKAAVDDSDVQILQAISKVIDATEKSGMRKGPFWGPPLGKIRNSRRS